MGRKRKNERFYKQAWFWAMIGVLVAIVYYFGDDVAWFFLGPRPDQQAQQRATYDEGMAVLDEAIRRRDPSVLDQKWCGEAREAAERIVREGDKRRVSVSSVQHGLRFPGRPQIVADEVWQKGTTEVSYSFKVWLGTCGCSTLAQEIPVLDSCIVKFFPTISVPLH